MQSIVLRQAHAAIHTEVHRMHAQRDQIASPQRRVSAAAHL